MILAKFVELAKRQMRYGKVSNTSDQVTEDIVSYLNMRARRVLRKWDWDWNQEPISVSLVAGIRDYTLSATIGVIRILEAGGDDYLRPITFKRYYQWVKRSTESPGVPSRYLKLGRNSSGAHQIRLWPTPESAGTMTGFGKKKWTNMTVADIAAGTEIPYFPEGILDILLLGVKGDIAEAMGDKIEAAAKDRKFDDMLNELVAEEESQPDEEIRSPPPDYIIHKRRRRGGTSVV